MAKYNIEDRIEIEDLISKCGYASDRRDYKLMRSLYHDDAIDDHGEFCGNIDDFIIYLKQREDEFESISHINTNIVCLINGDYAESQCREVSFLRLKGSTNVNITITGRHFDKFERRDNIWKFSRRSLAIDWVQIHPDIPDPFNFGNRYPSGKADRDDPVYAQLPGLMMAL